MGKSNTAKAFTKWERANENARASAACARQYYSRADRYEEEGDAEKEKFNRKMGREEERKAEKQRAVADALFTEEVKAEITARETFKVKFALFINEWATKFADNEMKEYNAAKEIHDTEWANLRALYPAAYTWEIRHSAEYEAFQEMYEKHDYFHMIISHREIAPFDYEKALEKYRYAVMMQLYDTNSRVIEYVGTVTNLTSVSWTANGLEGVVEGTDGTAFIRSILAGGYNIQRLHVRMIVTKLS